MPDTPSAFQGWIRELLFFGYRLLTTSVVFLGILAFPLVALCRRRWLVGLAERLGGLNRSKGPEKNGSSGVWIHAASVGEVRLALPVIAALRQSGWRVRLSTTTVTGRDLARKLVPEARPFLAPIDHPIFVGRAFRRLAPKVLLLVETELWPELLRRAFRGGVPVLLVNGRISHESFGRYLRWRPLFSPLLAGLRGVLPRSREDWDRLQRLGCRSESLVAMGDLKGASLSSPRKRPLRKAPPWVLVAGSLHQSEWEAWLRLLRILEGEPLFHVLVPRHMDRLDHLLSRLEEDGWPVRLWSSMGSEFPDPEAGKVLLVDTVGDLESLYQWGDIAFVGGSLLSIGGHNLLEPAIAGRPVLFGKGIANQKEAAADLLEAGGGRMVENVEELADLIRRWLRQPERLEQVGSLARKVAMASRSEGATLVEKLSRSLMEPIALDPFSMPQKPLSGQ